MDDYIITKDRDTANTFSRAAAACLSARYPHLIRMYDEITELKGRYAKLMSYYDNHRSQLDAKQCDLIMAQRFIMEHYIEILQARIDYDTQLYSK